MNKDYLLDEETNQSSFKTCKSSTFILSRIINRSKYRYLANIFPTNFFIIIYCILFLLLFLKMILSFESLLIILFLASYQAQSHILLSEFNNLFLNSYQQARANLLSKLDPLLILANDTLILKHQGKKTSTGINQPLYHNLKTISHIPFSIYLRLFNIESNDRNLSSDELFILKSYLHEVHHVRKSLNISDFSLDNKIFQIQYDIINLSITYLRSVIRSKQVNFTELKEFCRTSRNLFLINVKHAARAQLDKLHSIVYPIYTKQFNRTEQKTVQILILGPKGPRNGFIIKQYFEKLLDDEHAGSEQILYAENLTDEQLALNVLGSWLLDTHTGEAFFDDRTRLHRDLLMDESSAYIKKLFEYEQT